MTATSDLDFILLYDAPDTESDGPKSLSTSHYYARLTQRLVAAISAPTAEGVLYEADMRLRPSGNAGPLATSITGFRAYHRDNAWTWEHLALSRARVIAADGDFGFEIDAAISEIMSRPRNRANTIADVVDMRARIARDRKPRHRFDLKLADGGLMDLEFIAQSAQLVAGAQIGLPQALTARVLSRLAALDLVPDGQRLAQIHDLYSMVLQVMSSALVHPFKQEAWSDAFKDLLAGLTHYPDFTRLELNISEMQAEVSKAASDWYGKAAAL
jgi:glutamate-ammonia-ligase adenylyltransferase